MSQMTQEQYDMLVDLFAHPGYKFIIEGLDELKGSLQEAAVDNATTNDQWQFLRGQMAQMRSFIGYETFIHHMWKELQKLEAEEENDDAPYPA